tara:strand:+ start:1 stop:3834 length:3834 start_codon:yes stop_codon:yes gene_type:complete
MQRYTTAASAATVANRTLAASGRAVSSAVALLGGPAGVAILAAAGLYAFRDELGLIPDPARDAEAAIREVTAAIEGTDKAATQARINALTAQLADFKAEAEASAEAWNTFDPGTAMLDGVNMAQAGAAAFATVTEHASGAAAKVKATEQELARLHKQLADFDRPNNDPSTPQNESASDKATQALMAKTALLAHQNQLLAQGYSLEEARFIAAYAHADELTQAYLRQQQVQRNLLGLQHEEAELLQALAEGNEQKINAQIAKQQALASTVQQFLNTDFSSNAFEAFDELGRSLYGVADALDELADRQDAFNQLKAQEGLTAQDVAKINAKQAQNQISAYGDITGAAKGFFDQGSKGYQALQAAEQTFRVFEIAMAGKALAAKLLATQTATAATVASVAPTVAAESAKATAAGTAAAASSMVGTPFPANLAALAATLAALAGIGVLISGGSRGATAPTADQTHRSAMGLVSGTVLGSTDASDSLSASMDTLATLADSQLGYTMQMAQSLRNIEATFIGFNQTVAQVDNFFKGTNFGAVTEGLFSNPDAPYSVDAFITPTVGDVIAGALIDRMLATNNSIRDGKSDDYNARNESLYRADDALAQLYTQSVNAVVASTEAAIQSLGLSIDGAIADIEIRPFEIDPRWDSEQVDTYVTAYFSALGDTIVGEVAPALQDFQQGGEGLFETLTRVAGETFVLRDAVDSLGLVAGQTPLELMSMADALGLAAGGLSALTENVNGFLDFALTEPEQFTRTQGQVDALFNGLNLALPAIRSEVVNLVRSLDLTTEAGQQAFTTLTSASKLLDDYFSRIENSTRDATALLQSALQDTLTQGMPELERKLLEEGQRYQAALNELNGYIAAGADILGGEANAFAALLTAHQRNVAAIQQQQLRDSLAAQKAAITENLSALRSAVEAELAGLKRWANDERARLQSQAQQAQTDTQQAMAQVVEQVSQLERLASALASSVETLQPNLAAFDRYARQRAQQQLSQALSGDLPSAEALSPILATLRQDAAGQFTNRTDYLRDFYRTQNQMRDLLGRTRSTLTEEQQTRAVLTQQAAANDAYYNEQLAALDAQLAAAQQQVEATLGIDNGLATLQSLTAALTRYEQAEELADAELEKIDQQLQQADAQHNQQMAELTALRQQHAQELEALWGVNNSVVGVQSAVWSLSEALSHLATNNSALKVPGFANGGRFAGGLRVVGEAGPELEFTGPSHIANHTDTLSRLDNRPMVDLLQNIHGQLAEIAHDTDLTENHSQRIYRKLQLWEGQGIVNGKAS